MAVSRLTVRDSRKLFISAMAIALSAWILFFGWALFIWISYGFDKAVQDIHQLSTKQREIIAEFSEFSLPGIIENAIPKKQLVSFAPFTYYGEMVHQKYQASLINIEPLNSPRLLNFQQELYLKVKQLHVLLAAITQIFFIKCMMLLAAIPLFILAIVAGVVDGLNQRAIRTASLGRESSFVFHQFNRWFKKTLILLSGLWLAMPYSISPSLLFVPMSILLGVVVSTTASRFKKYL